MVWMPSSKIPALLIEEFEAENEAAQSTSQPQVAMHVTNPIPAEEPPHKVAKHDQVVQQW